MFKNNFVVAVKASGKVLREFDDTVYLPFGTEYSILLKNLFRKKVKVHVKIDGQDALDGKNLIIDPHDSIDLKRFIKNGNLDAGNAFKFIEKTEKIEKYRGNRAEDGLITVEYEFETNWNDSKFQGSSPIITTYPYRGFIQNYGKGSQVETLPSGLEADCYKDNQIEILPTGLYDPIYEDYYIMDSATVYHSQTLSSVAPQTNTVIKNSAGITAPGSIQKQKFTSAGMFIGDGIKHVATLQLKGLVQGQREVTKPVTVTRLKRCSMCGTNVRQVAKFCHECGASVEIV